MEKTRVVVMSDIIDPSTGKSAKQVNAEKMHQIPLNAVVKVMSYNHATEEYEEKPSNLVLYVVRHDRDCDQTPLYGLSLMTVEKFKEAEDNAKEYHKLQISRGWPTYLYGPGLDSGYSEESLKVMALPNEIPKSL